ncbi:MAG: sensor histidine kinase [Actinomycetota bacterium]|nr:sensor histidine kinase [Actinomycetota bacterium]
MTRGRGLPRGGRLFGPVFGLLWLAYPIYAILTSNPSLEQLVFAVAGTALFAGIFLWLLWLHEPLQATTEASEVRKRRAAVVSLAVLTLVLVLVCGDEWLILFIHTSIAAGLMLPGRDAYVAITGVAILMIALGRAAGWEWPSIGQFVLIVGALGLWTSVFARQIATVAELRAAREEIARLAVAEERLRFARDLHDLLGHSLSLITLKSELARRLLPTAPEKAKAEVRDIEGVARRALREVREAVTSYRQPTLEGELAGAREMLEAAGIACWIENKVNVLPNTMDAVLAWTVREGVTNVIRHSHAGRCEIRVTQDSEEIHAEITDDGHGSRSRDEGAIAGSGLSGLAERVTASGGDFEAGSLPGGGFRLRVSLPLRDDTTSSDEPASKARGVREDGRR